MTKEDVIKAIEKKLEEMDITEKKMLNKGTIKTELDIRKLREKYYEEAEKIAEDNGYKRDYKWMLWNIVCKRHPRKYNI